MGESDTSHSTIVYCCRACLTVHARKLTLSGALPDKQLGRDRERKAAPSLPRPRLAGCTRRYCHTPCTGRCRWARPGRQPSGRCRDNEPSWACFLCDDNQPPRRRLAGCYFFLVLAWARSEAIGPRSCLGVFGLRRSLPACEAVFFEVVI